MEIRDEKPGEEPAIRALTEAAFAPMAYSDGSEGAIVDDLRAGGGLHISLVAIEQGELLGHAAFSPVRIGAVHSGWFGLGPVSVTEPHQKSGFGSALINAGLERLRMQGAAGVVVLGDPGYYGRFGFESVETIWYGSGPSPYFQRLVLNGPDAQGQAVYHSAFGED